MARPVEKNWSEAQIIEDLRQCALDVGGKKRKTLMVIEYRQWSKGRNDVAKIHSVYQKFETWPKACKAAGLEPVRYNVPRVSPEEIEKSVRAALTRHRKKHGETPMLERDYEKMYRNRRLKDVDVSLPVILRYCGTWSEAARRYEFGTGRVKALTDRPLEEWVTEVAEICEEYGGALSIRTFNEVRPPGFPSSRRLATAFGGWEVILDKAGYKPSKYLTRDGREVMSLQYAALEGA